MWLFVSGGFLSVVAYRTQPENDDVLQLNGVPYKFVANIHDEWQLEVPKDKADFIGQFAVDSIIKAGEHFNLRCPLDGEYKIGGNWSETH